MILAGDSQHLGDLKLVKAAKCGDSSAVKDFAQRIKCAAKFLSIQNRRMGSPANDEELADLAQDVVLVVLRKMGGYEGRGSIESWVYRIARLELLVYLRERGRRPAPVGDMLDAAGGGSPKGDERFAITVVHRALARLRPHEVELVELRHLEGLTWDKIGARLDCPANTAKTRYHRALVKLQNYVHDRDGEDG